MMLPDTCGPVYDISYNPQSNTWRRQQRFAYYASNNTLRWEDGSISGKYLGWNEIRSLDDLDAFSRVMDETRLPIGVGEEENCQSWVKDVIINAVDEDVLDPEALLELRDTPNF